MKSTMQAYNGAVFFVDILGFSALTKGQVVGITKEDYHAWGISDSVSQPHSILAATIIVEFRDVLHQLKTRYPEIHVGQLSDCAFIWSEDIMMLVQSLHFVMWTMIQEKGILCRGGVAYGEIVEVDNVDYNLGAFIVGDAVTKAVKNEGRLKGPRVAMDVSFPDVLWHSLGKSAINVQFAHDIFYPNKSEIDLSVVDEYRWYLCEDNIVPETSILSFEKQVELTKKRLHLANILRFHPRMGWNSRGAEGLVQLKAGEISLSANRLLGVLHNFETDNVNECERKLSRLMSANNRIDADAYYPLSDEPIWLANLNDLD